MKKLNNRGWWATLIILLLLVIDQIIKLWVKTHMHLGESIHVTDWFYIMFIENNGMAYGMTFINKIVLSLFRIVAVSIIAYYIYKVVNKHRFSYIICMSMILAGAAGNIIDCLLYGQMFTVSTPYNISEFTDFGAGYAPILQGKVVDMFYFPLFTWPEWMPFVGGNIFFSPIFNFADSCISVGVVMLILFFRKEMETLTGDFTEGTPLEKYVQNKE